MVDLTRTSPSRATAGLLAADRAFCYISSMTAAQFDPEAWDAEADLFDDVDPTAEARSLAEAEADVAAGRLISHERVSAWLMSLGTEKYLARPEPD